MENKKIDFVVHEADMNKLENANIRMYRLNVTLIIVLFLVIMSILIYSMLPDETIKSKQTATGSNISQNVGN